MVFMSDWVLWVFFQERGSKKETRSEIRFNSKGDAEAAMKKLEKEYPTLGSEDSLVIESARGRVSFLKQDYRRMDLHEHAGPAFHVA
jgi:hypothetical protein